MFSSDSILISNVVRTNANVTMTNNGNEYNRKPYELFSNNLEIPLTIFAQPFKFYF